MADRSVSVRLGLRVDQYTAALKKAGADTRAFTAAADKDLQALGSKYVSLGQKMTVGLTAPLALLARQAVNTATDAQEAMNRVNVVFGASADDIRAWAEGSVDSMGLARHEAASAASNFGTIFAQLGIGGDRAREMSTGMVELASDFASFRNADITQVLLAQEAAFRQEYDSLQRYLPGISQAAIEQRALADTGKATTAELNLQDKALATVALMFDQAGPALGDFARTQDDTANAMRRANGAYQDAVAELGENLLPIIAKGALTFADFAQAFGALPEGAQSLILGFGGLAAAAGPLIFITGSLIKNLEVIRSVGPRAAAALRFGGVAVGVFAVAQAIEYLGDEAMRLRYGTANADELTLALAKLGKEGDVTGELADRFGEGLDKLPGLVDKAKQRFAGSLEEAAAFLGGDETVESAKNKIDELDKALAGLAATNADVAKSVFEQIIAASGEDADEVTELFDDYTNALAANETQQLLTGGAAGSAGAAIGGQAEEVLTAAEAIEAYSSALDDAYAAAFSVDEITGQIGSDLADLAQRVADAREAGDGWASSLDASNTSGLANISTIQGLVRGGLDLADAMAQQGASQGQITAAMSALYGQLTNTLAGLGFNRAEAERLLGVLMTFPSAVDIRINVDTERAEERLARLLRLIQLNAHGLDVLEAEKWASRSAGVNVPTFDLGGIGALPTLTPSFGAGGGKDPADEALQRRREEDARQGRLAEFGGVTVEEYQRYLDRRIAATQAYTAEWGDLMHEQARINEQIGQGWREAAEYARGLEDAGWEMLARQHEVGELSTNAYLDQLERRLVGLQQYSDEWMRTWREINELKDDITQDQLDIMAAVEKERLYWVGFNETMEQRFTSGLREVAAAPVVVQGGSSQSTAFSQTNYITAPSTGGAFSTANQKMRDAAFLMGL